MYISCIIIGSQGHTGIELINLIKNHTNIKYIYLLLRKKDKYIKKNNNTLIKKKIRKIKIKKNIKYNILFICLPNNNLQILIKNINIKIKIIDLSADFRFKYKNLKIIYNTKHLFPKIQKKFLYGYTEEIKNIKNTNLISNPGCYVNLSLNIIMPLIRKNITKKKFLINAINGTTGINKKINTKLAHCTQYSNILPYSLYGHKHTLEIINFIRKISYKKKLISLCTAHGNFNKGIFLILITNINKNLYNIKNKIINFIYWYNKKNYFIKIFNMRKKTDYKYSLLSNIINHNYSQISFDISKKNKEIRFIGNTDNLIKGSSGTSIENMNILFKIKNSYGL